jgi:hypothetical protein
MNSDKFTPRLLGIMFIFVAVASLLSGLLLGSLNFTPIGPPDNISEIMTTISDNPTTMQMSIVGELITAIGIVLLALLLYTTLKKQNKIIALWAFGLWIGEAIMLAVREISAFALLYTSQEFVKAGAPDSSYFQTLGGLFYESTQFGYAALMVFYCLGGILFYYLFLKSKYVPKVLPLWGIIVASLGFIGTLFGFFVYNVPMYVFLPILPFELAIGVWLMVKGFRPQEIKSKSG